MSQNVEKDEQTERYVDIRSPNTGRVYRFSRNSFLGTGSFGSVFEAEIVQGEEKGEKVALKELFGFASDMKRDAKNRIEFDRENKILQLISDCKNSSEHTVKQIEYFICSNDKVYMVAELCTEGTLQQLIKNEALIPEKRIFTICYSLVKGLYFLQHELFGDKNKGILFRDLKPKNILLSHYWDAVICDFGFAKVTVEINTPKCHTFCGTLPYESPQILLHQPFSGKTDVWSLAITIYEMLQGRLPYNCPQFLGEQNGPRQYPLMNNSRAQARQHIMKNQKELVSRISEMDFKHCEEKQFWKKVLMNCLAYREEERWSVRDLYECFLEKATTYVVDRGERRVALGQTTIKQFDQKKQMKQLTGKILYQDQKEIIRSNVSPRCIQKFSQQDLKRWCNSTVMNQPTTDASKNKSSFFHKSVLFRRKKFEMTQIGNLIDLAASMEKLGCQYYHLVCLKFLSISIFLQEKLKLKQDQEFKYVLVNLQRKRKEARSILKELISTEASLAQLITQNIPELKTLILSKVQNANLFTKCLEKYLTFFQEELFVEKRYIPSVLFLWMQLVPKMLTAQIERANNSEFSLDSDGQNRFNVLYLHRETAERYILQIKRFQKYLKCQDSDDLAAVNTSFCS